MSSSTWRRPFILAAASVALVTTTACAAQAATPIAPAPGSHAAAPADRSAHCGEGGEGGKGGAPGQPGEPGEPGKPGCAPFHGLSDLPGRPKSKLSRLDKARIALAVLTGRVTEADAAKKYKVREKEISKWEQNLLDGGWLEFLRVDS
ncbi:hypothetical protein GCM10010260_10580 [Streptomyces filipinensis]|uniref:DUF1153 domain-containing protein n=1 Tax=Streptomyces filipinensis TaxID=66887 RepID=A0A918M8T7_9ACTN|nr:hypothetical protein [Streptomyces filipinensis]GGU80242.1 hypothetical protein GCM10010260_10580 [Streptomyces filipinensis]